VRHYAGVRIPVGSVVSLALALALSMGVQAQTVKIRLASLTTILVQHDTKPKGRPNKGDSIEFKDLLLNKVPQFGKAKGKPVAWDEGEVLYTSATTRKIKVIATFPGVGSITYVGVFTSNESSSTVARIIGGTGGFKEATGTVTIGSGSQTAPNIFVVTVPHTIDISTGTGVA
jgi:hypothetical protein